MQGRDFKKKDMSLAVNQIYIAVVGKSKVELVDYFLISFVNVSFHPVEILLAKIKECFFSYLLLLKIEIIS